MPMEGMELHAAEALMQLRCASHRAASDIKVEINGTASLFLNCLPTPETPSTAALSPVVNTQETARHSSDSPRDDNSETNSQSSFDSPIAYRAHLQKNRHVEPAYTRKDVQPAKQVPKVKKVPQKNLFKGYGSIQKPLDSVPKKTCEQGTQTDMYPKISLSELAKMDSIISELYAKIRSLQNQLKETRRRSPSPSVDELDPDVSTDVLKIQQYNQQDNSYNKRKRMKLSSSSCNTVNTMDSDATDDEWKPDDNKPSKQIIREALKLKGSEMVPIGEGYASVPARLLKQIDWSSYTGATRKLLTAVFSRRVLATHSLTGKPSPAFPGKPAKKRLEPELVNDIVQAVVERCGVPESVVRTSITTKCADESKMYRSRQQNIKKQQSFNMNQENVPPSPCDDDDSSDRDHKY